ncbi:pentapeptide repeat-containing protein [Rhizobium binae]|uniref:pentapeptide repeat-containing protein n=1 Tax=Rhizobium binae TaxID=1138190 RepID=UPI003DA8DA09
MAKNKTNVSEPNQYPLRIYQSQKLVHAKGFAFCHAQLIDVSGKKQVYEEVDFSYSIFTRGYFHQAEFRACNFTGARFVDCNFRNATFADCNFSYSDFTGCRIETDEVLRNLPDQPNVRRELLQILRKNALSMGDVAAGRAFVIAELAAKKEHLRRAWKQEENYYKKKYGGFRNQSLVLAKRIGLWLDGFLWGHGEKLWNLPIAVIAILAVFSAISSATWAFSLSDPSVSQLIIMFKSFMIYYISLFLDAPYRDSLPHIVVLDWIVVIFRYVSLGILVSGLFRWLSHR